MIKGALRGRIVFLIAIETGLLGTVFAQNTGVKRDVVQRGDISVAGREAVVVHVEIAPGARTGRHTHPGDEMDYVLEGTGQLLVDGQPVKPLKPGDASVIPQGTIHDAYNNGTSPLLIAAVFVVDKGKPLTTPVQ